jgi:hypothetical protein
MNRYELFSKVVHELSNSNYAHKELIDMLPKNILRHVATYSNEEFGKFLNDAIPTSLSVTNVSMKNGDALIEFENGVTLQSDHESSCCEHHWLCVKDLTLEDFEGLKFDLKGDFFERIKGYGIALLPVHGHPVRIPGYGENNGYYSSELTLVLTKDNTVLKTFDITECQDY